MEEEKPTLKQVNDMLVRFLNLKSCYADIVIEIRNSQIVRVRETSDFMTKRQIDNFNTNLVI